MASRRQQRKNQAAANRSRFNSGGNGWFLTAGYHCADTKRNVWQGVGYPDQLTFDDHWSMASRLGEANAGINRIVDKCWSAMPIVSDGEYDGKRNLTPFEQDVNELIERHQLWQRFKGLDWRQRVGRYAGLIPIVKESGASSPGAPMTKLNGVKAVMKLVPVFESQLAIDGVNTISDMSSPDYGMPQYYQFRQDATGDRNPLDANDVQLHPSRVFILAEGADDGSIFGIPALEAGFNSLLSMEKAIAAGAEGLWKNAKQRTVYNVKDGQVLNQLKTDAATKQKFDNNIDDFDSGNSASVMLYGMEANTLQATIADPQKAYDIALMSFAASIKCPATILVGQQTGRLASDEDQSDWALTAQSRCNNLLIPSIKAFLEYMVGIGAVRKPSKEIVVEWPELADPAPSEKIDIAKRMEEVNKLRYESGRGGPIFTDAEVREAAGYDAEMPDEEEGFADDEGLGADTDITDQA